MSQIFRLYCPLCRRLVTIQASTGESVYYEVVQRHLMDHKIAGDEELALLDDHLERLWGALTPFYGAA
jgi:hypothetical protein